LKSDLLPLLKEVWDDFQKDEAGQRGAALAYYAMFSVFPLLLLLLAALGFVLRYWDEAINTRQEILNVVAQQFSPQLSESLNQMLEGVQREASAATGLGLVTLLLGASGVFYQLDTSFNKIWRVPGKPQPSGIIKAILSTLRGKLLSFVMVLVVGLLFLVSLALTGITHALLGVLSHLPAIGGAAGFMLGLAITLALNTLTSLCCLNICRTLRWPGET
jgi:membrane protein